MNSPCKHWYEGLVARSEDSCPYCRAELAEREVVALDTVVERMLASLDSFGDREYWRQVRKSALAAAEDPQVSHDQPT